MDKPSPDKHWKGDSASRHMPILAQASEELAYEAFRKAVEKKKQELLTKKPLWRKLFPFKITIQRI